MSKPNQQSYWYRRYQICLYPMDQTLRDPSVYSYQVMVWNPDREVIYQTYFDTDEVFWSGLETPEKLLAYCKRLVDNIEGSDETD